MPQYIKGCWKKNLTVWYLDILGSNLTYLDAIFNLDHKRNVRDMSLNWQIAKYYKDPMKECKMRCKTKSKGVNMNIYTMTLSKISSTKNNHHSPCPIHLINPKLYAKWVFMKIKYFKNILKVCELQGRGGNEHMHTCIAHVSRSWTIQIILQTFSL